MRPVCIQWNVGKDAHGRTVKLTNEQGKYTVTVAANQRDDTVTIRDLTPEVILLMAEAVNSIRPTSGPKCKAETWNETTNGGANA